MALRFPRFLKESLATLSCSSEHFIKTQVGQEAEAPYLGAPGLALYSEETLPLIPGSSATSMRPQSREARDLPPKSHHHTKALRPRALRPTAHLPLSPRSQAKPIFFAKEGLPTLGSFVLPIPDQNWPHGL